ncbi:MULTISPECIES: MATE family efflux transporter [Paenibacillus]|uniref:MATE family efflux transporter n=1 Tax=Paenibacillus TaxID=44249 RepID=UPI0022B8716E|nr:MATE family efflux transporter [Paenibacillus caseinilyticus]MCZ8520841.1 MATE family efflux transporter [Paenibacillus caseinilyticus]
MKAQPTVTSLARLTWPIFVEMLLHLLMGSLDVYMLSHYSSGAVAAVGIANQIVQLFIMLFGFVAAGTTIVISQELGAGLHRKAAAAARTAVTLNAVFGLLCSLALWSGASLYLSWLGTPPELMGDGLTYVRIVGGFLFLEAVMLTLSAILRSHGLTRQVMYIGVGMNVVHVIGNYLVLYSPAGLPEFGIEGVAWSTVLSRVLGMTLMALVLITKLGSSSKTSRFWGMSGEYTGRLLRIGIPSTIEYLAYYVSQLCITSFIAGLGIKALTARVFVDSTLGIVSLIATSIAIGTQIMIGHLIGGRRTAEAMERCMHGIRWSMIFGAAAAVLIAVEAEALLGFFTDDPVVIGWGTRLLWLMLLFQPAHSMCMVYQHVLKAVGDANYPAVLGVLFMIGIRVPAAYVSIVYLDLGLLGVYASFVADEWIRALLMRRRWRSRRWEVPALQREDLTESIAARSS